MKWPWSFLRKNRSNGDKDDEGEQEGLEKYEQHGVKEKGRRARQLHRCDSTSKMCLDDIDEQIQKLKTLKCKIKSRNGRIQHECKEES